MKLCKGCKKEKLPSEFYPSKGNSDGRTGKCKECIKLDVKNNKEDYDLTEKGVIRVIYKTQVGNSKKRGHPSPGYSKSELALWMYKNGFKVLFDSWVDSGYQKDKKPSVDRIDDYKHYSLDNIRLVTWLDNRLKQYREIKSGIGKSGSRCKRVIKINSSGVVICEYVSFSKAVRDIGYSIEYPIRNGTKCKNGFFWKYAE